MDLIEHRVRERAYYIWEGEGRVHGRADAHWLRAEAEIAGPTPVARAAEAIPVKAPRKAARTKAVAETPAEAKTAVKAAAKKPAKSGRTADIETAVPKIAAPKIAAPKAAAPKAAPSKAAKAVKALVAVGTKAKPARADLH